MQIKVPVGISKHAEMDSKGVSWCGPYRLIILVHQDIVFFRFDVLYSDMDKKMKLPGIPNNWIILYSFIPGVTHRFTSNPGL